MHCSRTCGEGAPHVPEAGGADRPQQVDVFGDRRPVFHFEGVDAQRRSFVAGCGEHREVAGRSLRRRVAAWRQGQLPVLAFGGLDDQEGDVLGVQALQQAQAGVGLPGPGDPGDEQVTGQGGQGHAVRRSARCGPRGGKAAIAAPGRVRHNGAER